MFETPDSRYMYNRSDFYRQYFEKLRALPGVEAAGGSLTLPMTDNSMHISFENPEHPLPPGQLEDARFDLVSPNYFRTMNIPLLSGRDFSDANTVKAPPVMIVSRGFAKKFLHTENVIGKKLKPEAGNDGPVLREIVGVVGDVRHGATSRDLDPGYYLPATQFPRACCMYSVVRTQVEPLSLEPAAKNLVASMDRNIPVTDVRTMQDRIGLELAQPRFAMVLLSAFSGLALVLTLVGLYGVMAHSVARRRREIGVRLALGAPRAMVFRMVLQQAAVLVIIGIGIGITATLAFGSILQSYLYGTGPRNPLVLAGVCILVATTGLLAAYLPARRAMQVDPAVALRYE
jgi:putative ABC transport system permease protein